MITRHELLTFIEQLLKPQEFVDYGPNGLQVEGAENIRRIGFAVSATVDSIQKCIEADCQALVVHHGLFWKFHGARPITGPFAQRIKPLIQNQINLLAHHLPLDAHLEEGNAAQIAKILQLERVEAFGCYKGKNLGVKGWFKEKVAISTLAKKIEKLLSHPVIVSTPHPGGEGDIKNIGIITGGANNEWSFALEHQLDAYLTGEISEYNWHDAREAGVTFFAAGHHATERPGIQNLMKLVANQYPQITCHFFDSPNPA